MGEKKIAKADAEALAMTALRRGNPYIEKSVVFQIDKSDRYLYADKIFTKKEIDKAYYETALHDVRAGFAERMAGYYDKWYRYTRVDNGRAYDIGATYAANTGRCGNDFTNYKRKQRPFTGRFYITPVVQYIVL